MSACWGCRIPQPRAWRAIRMTRTAPHLGSGRARRGWGGWKQHRPLGRIRQAGFQGCQVVRVHGWLGCDLRARQPGPKYHGWQREAGRAVNARMPRSSPAAWRAHLVHFRAGGTRRAGGAIPGQPSVISIFKRVLGPQTLFQKGAGLGRRRHAALLHLGTLQVSQGWEPVGPVHGQVPGTRMPGTRRANSPVTNAGERTQCRAELGCGPLLRIFSSPTRAACVGAVAQGASPGDAGGALGFQALFTC